jgi:hypothetical protein
MTHGAMKQRRRFVQLSCGPGRGRDKQIVEIDRRSDHLQASLLPYSSAVCKPRTHANEALRLHPRKGRGNWNGWAKPGPKPPKSRRGVPLRECPIHGAEIVSEGKS